MTPASQKSETQAIGAAGSQVAHNPGVLGSDQDIRPSADLEQTSRFLRTLDPTTDRFHFRTVPDNGSGPGRNYYGTLDELAINLQLDNGNGRGVFVVINEGGQKASEIARVRAVVADFDKPEAWARVRTDPGLLQIDGRDPHLVVETSPGKFHVYWKTDGLPPDQFQEVQEAIIARYGSDPNVKDLSRVMRLPGFLHAKGTPHRSRLLLARPQQPAFAAAEIVAAFSPALGSAPVLAPPFAAFAPGAQFGHYSESGKVVETGRHDDLLKLAGRFARMVVFEGMSRDAAVTAVLAEASRGRWTRDMPAHEIMSALDGAIAKCREGKWAAPAANDPAPAITNPVELAQAFARAVRPLTAEHLAKARLPHPHVFSDGKAGLFPVGEATILGGGMREGKTTTVAGIIRSAILGRPVAGLPCTKPMRVIIYSAEDDPEQYGRLLLAMMEQESDEADRKRLHAGFLVPDLSDPALENYRALVKLAQNRQPVPGPIVDAIIESVHPLTQSDDPVGGIVFETISTVSQAEEDNAGLSVLAAVLKRVAKKLGVAVVATHHTNQAADREFADLDFSVRALRGGSALPSDSRQILLAVDLGSDAKPMPGKLLPGGKHVPDRRNWLRKFVTSAPADPDGFNFAPYGGSRVTMLVPINTSKAADPAPEFFEWVETAFGPTVKQMRLRDEIAGLGWQQIVAAMYLEHAAKRSKEGKAGAEKLGRELAEVAEKGEQERRLCVDAVRRLEGQGTPATVSAVAKAIDKGKEWPKERLVRCVELGLLTCAKETVRGRGDKVFDVYRLTERARPEAEDDEADADGLIPAADPE